MAESAAKPSSDAEVEGLSSSSETSEDECIRRNLSSKPTLRELRQLPVTKWYNLGLQLEVNQEELEKIQSKHPQNDRICQTKMFGMWLREVENPNYEKLLKALASIGRRDIAVFMCDKEGFTLDSITRAPSSSNIPESKDLIPSLQPSRVPELKDLMHLQVSDWNRLGLALKLNSHELGIIEKDHQGDTKTQTLKMFKHWLKTQPDASYEQLIKSLCEVGDKTVANSLSNKYGFTLDSITRLSSPPHLPSLHTSGIPAQLMKRPITKDAERQPVDVSQKQVVPSEKQTTLLFEHRLVGITRLGEKDVPKLMTILSKYAYKWEDIGIALGFTVPELRGISCQQALILNSPNSFLLEMLNGWVNWPNEAHSSLATVEALETALQSQLVGLGVVSEQLRNDLQQTTTSDNEPSQIRAPPSSSQPPKIPECIERYARYLKSRYCKMPLLPQGEWPPTLGSQYSEITMVERDRTLPDQESVEESLEASFRGKVDELAKNEKVIKSLDELFTAQAGDADSSSLKVLIEGVPGAGKTTLVQKTCKDWAEGRSLQRFNLVVLVVLRKKEIERAESVEELLSGDDPDLKEAVVLNLKRSSGEHVLFIFDGFDELNERLQLSSSIFLKIIQGEHLHNCAAILTSRPYASDVLRTDERIHRHVEILGFTEKQIESYVMNNISNKSTAHSLVKSLTEKMAITSFSYTPLSCSILLYIFKQKKFKLPSTLTELFDAFISSIVKRHAKKQKVLSRWQKQKLNLKNLPEPLNHQFSALCKLAYDSLVKGKFVFSLQDIEDMYPGEDVEANLLSLMTSATSFSVQGEETHYQFLHMTIQEFLAAKWIATQSENEQERFLTKNWDNLKLKSALVFFAGITKLKKNLFAELFGAITCSRLVHSALEGLQRRQLLPHSIDYMDPRPYSFKYATAVPVDDPFEFETVPVSLQLPSLSRAIRKHNSVAAQVFLCLASMIDETKDLSLVRRIFRSSSIKGIYLDFCKLTPMDCTAVANFLSNCPYHIQTLHFNFCSLTSVSLEIFHRISTTTPKCWDQCKEVQMNYNAPRFSASLSLLPQIRWFQHTKILCLRGLQYPKGLPPEAFQLHSLLSLKALSDLTVTVERIPKEHLKDHEAVVMTFFETLETNNTLSTLTYDQFPPATKCEVFVQLMSALMQNKLSLILGHAQVINEKGMILPSKTCFKICFNGLIGAMKLADARSITILKAHWQDLFLESCSCQSSIKSKFKLRFVTPCDQCDSIDPAPAGIYCSNCSTNLCESCSRTIHQFKKFKNHTLIPVESITPCIGALADILKIRSLEVLDISGCNPTNEVTKHIGAGLVENKSMKQLNIKALAGAEAVHIFRALEHNSSVQKFNISLAEGIGSSETAVTALSQMLKVNKSLSVLDLSGCGVTDAIAQHIASGLAENKTLQALNINSDQLKSEGAGYILQSLQQNETLRTLTMFDLDMQITHVPLTLNITAGACKKQSLALLVSSLVHNTSIDKLQMFTGTGVLDLSQCGITDAMIAAGLTENSSLKQLDLSRNEITSVGAVRIFRSLEHNTSLDKLLLSHNSQLAMGDSELFGSRLQQMLATNKSLTVLDLSACGVTDAVAQHIASGLTKNKTLKTLSIDSEHLTREGITYIYQSLKQTEAVEILKRYGINLEILYNPFYLVISIEHNTCAAMNILKSLEQDTTVKGLVIRNLPSLEKQDNFLHYLFADSDDSEAGEPVMCGLPTSDRINQRSRCYTLPASCNLSARSDDSEALGCAVEGMLTVNRTLRILKLQDCHLNDVITGHIATGLTKNSSLKQLNLKSNRMLTGTGAARIFKSLEHNTSLEELDLSSNKFYQYRTATNDDSEVLGCAVEGMLTVNQTLRILNLRDCGLDDVITGHIATGLTKNSSLKQLNLKSNRMLTGTGAARIFKSLEHNTSLDKLLLSCNSQLAVSDSELFGCRLQQMLTANKSLSVLDLSGCGVTDAVAQHIASGLAENKTLQVLSVDSGHLTHEGVNCILQSLKKNEVMKILKQFGINLHILYNPFRFTISIEHDTHAALNIFKSLEQNTTMEGLVICKLPPTNNRVRDDEALGCAVEGMLTVNRTLRILKLQDCHLNDVITGHIATGLTKNSSLKQLNLKSNRMLTGTGAARIFKSLEHNTSLEELDLSSNKFYQYRTATNDDSEVLGCAVEGMLTVNQTLRILKLQDCHLNDVITGHIATGLTKNSSLKQLNLKSNRMLTGTGAARIFKSLEHNTSLEELDLSSNKFYQYRTATNDDSEVLGCAVEGMLTVNQTLRILKLQDCGLNDVTTSHIATGLQYNSSCCCDITEC